MAVMADMTTTHGAMAEYPSSIVSWLGRAVRGKKGEGRGENEGAQKGKNTSNYWIGDEQ